MFKEAKKMDNKKLKIKELCSEVNKLFLQEDQEEFNYMLLEFFWLRILHGASKQEKKVLVNNV